jgi:hypothetical protein
MSTAAAEAALLSRSLRERGVFTAHLSASQQKPETIAS